MIRAMHRIVSIVMFIINLCNVCILHAAPFSDNFVEVCLSFSKCPGMSFLSLQNLNVPALASH